MSEYLEGEGKAIKKMENVGFTEEQIDAIYHYVKFYIDSEDEWRESQLSDAKIELRQEIRKHAHLDGKVVIPYE